MPCTKCGNLLLLGMKGQMLNFCPKCEGLEIIPKNKILEMIGRSISELKITCCKKIKELDRDLLIIRLISFREGYLLRAKSHEFDFKIFLACTKAIADAQHFGVCNHEQFEAEDERLKNIIEHYINLTEYEKNFNLTEKGLMVHIEIPEDKKFHDYVEDQTLEPGKIVGKLTEDWIPFKENMSFLDMKTDAEIEKLYFDGKYPTTGKVIKENDLLDRIQLLCGIELSIADSKKFFRLLDEYKYLNEKGIDFIWNSALYAYNEIFKHEKNFFDKDHRLISIRKRVFIRRALQWGFSKEEIHKMYDNFVSNDIEAKATPLMVDLRGRLFIPAQTLVLFYIIFKIKISQGTSEDLRSEFGYLFENLVEFELQNKGFSLKPPKKPKAYYKNYKDDLYAPSFEIDFIAHKNNVVYVIESKSWLPRPYFLSKELIQERKRQIAEEVRRQQERVTYVSNNLEGLGFEPSNVRRVVSIILTLLKEPYEKLNGTYILRLTELEKLETLD